MMIIANLARQMRCWVVAAVGGALFALAMLGTPQQAAAQQCTPTLDFIRNPQGPFALANLPENTTLSVLLGASANSNAATITEVDVGLACANNGDAAPCNVNDDDPSANPPVNYVGAANPATDCPGVTWTANDDGRTVNLVATPALVLAPGEQCQVDLPLQILNRGTDDTPLILTGSAEYEATCAALNNSAAASFGYELTVNCAVEVDKQVSCDGGFTWFDVEFEQDDTGSPDDPNGDQTLSTACIGWNAGADTPAEDILIRHVVRNAGDIDLVCSGVGQDESPLGLFDTNSFIIPLGEEFDIAFGNDDVIFNNNVACSDAFAGEEPNTADVSCECFLDEEFIDVAMDTDSARFACLTPGLGLAKVCDPQDGEGENAIDISWDLALGNAPLANCELTDTVFEGACDVDGPTTEVVVEEVITTNDFPNPFDIPPADSTVVAATTLTTELCDGDACCNEATITCEIEDAVDQACVEACLPAEPNQQDVEACIEQCPKTISATAFDDCEIPEGDCHTRTPGYWGTHPEAQEAVYAAAGGSVFSCGVDLATSAAETEGSGTEDLCSIGGGQAGKGKNKNGVQDQFLLDNTQRQLERQCAAANLNIAASAEIFDVSCEAVFEGIGNVLARCCNDADSVCNDGPNEFDTEECIGIIDDFNNALFDEADAENVVQGPADPKECRDAKSGFVNTRDRP